MIDRYCNEYLPNNKEKTYSQNEQKERQSRLDWWAENISYCVTPPLNDQQLCKMTQTATLDKCLKNLSHEFTDALKWAWLTEKDAYISQ